jgi:pSer/pThr/pTyr-binding forkhead associated (FHA) protein
MTLKLLVVQGRPVGKALVFGPGEYLLGRGPECQIRFNSDWVSRQHCQLRVGPASILLRDLGSRNGTLVNGRLVGLEQALVQGDQLQIGPVVFEVQLDMPDGPVDLLGPGDEVIRPADQDSSVPEKPMSSTTQYPSLPPEPDPPPG